MFYTCLFNFLRLIGFSSSISTGSRPIETRTKGITIINQASILTSPFFEKPPGLNKLGASFYINYVIYW